MHDIHRRRHNLHREGTTNYMYYFLIFIDCSRFQPMDWISFKLRLYRFDSIWIIQGVDPNHSIAFRPISLCIHKRTLLFVPWRILNIYTAVYLVAGGRCVRRSTGVVCTCLLCLLHLLIDQILGCRDGMLLSSNGDNAISRSLNHLVTIRNLYSSAALVLHFNNNLAAFANQGADDWIRHLHGDGLLYSRLRRGARGRLGWAVLPIPTEWCWCRWVLRINRLGVILTRLLSAVICRHVLVSACLFWFLHESKYQLASFDLLLFGTADGHSSLFNPQNPDAACIVSVHEYEYMTFFVCVRDREWTCCAVFIRSSLFRSVSSPWFLVGELDACPRRGYDFFDIFTAFANYDTRRRCWD